MTYCGCFECVLALVPECNGLMVVNREYGGMTPSGMTFSTLASASGGSVQMPRFAGISRSYLASAKFFPDDGGLDHLVWILKELKEQLRAQLDEASEEAGLGKA